MANQPIPAGNPVEQAQESPNAPSMAARFDPAMVHICVELFTRAALYAGAIGLIASLAAVLLAGE